jgi:preprotein translocase subunit SecG
MDTLFKIIMVVQVLSALLIIVLVLLQHGKGADMGAAFGSGASGSLFGATGSSNFVSKMTGVAAAVFFSCTLALSYIASNRGSSGVTDTGGGVMDSLPVSKPPVGAVPGVPASAPVSAPASVPATAPASGSASPAVPAGAASSASGSATTVTTPAPVAPSAPINQVPK